MPVAAVAASAAAMAVAAVAVVRVSGASLLVGMAPTAGGPDGMATGMVGATVVVLHVAPHMRGSPRCESASGNLISRGGRGR